MQILVEAVVNHADLYSRLRQSFPSSLKRQLPYSSKLSPTLGWGGHLIHGQDPLPGHPLSSHLLHGECLRFSPLRRNQKGHLGSRTPHGTIWCLYWGLYHSVQLLPIFYTPTSIDPKSTFQLTSRMQTSITESLPREPNLTWHRLLLSLLSSVQFNSITQSSLTLCDPMDCSTPGYPVHHQLPEFTQTHVHRVGDATQPSHPLLSPSPAFNLSHSNTTVQKHQFFGIQLSL